MSVGLISDDNGELIMIVHIILLYIMCIQSVLGVHYAGYLDTLTEPVATRIIIIYWQRKLPEPRF